MQGCDEKTYLAKTASRRHLILVKLNQEQPTYVAIDSGRVSFDRTISTP
jgi:hypothetical protein